MKLWLMEILCDMNSMIIVSETLDIDLMFYWTGCKVKGRLLSVSFLRTLGEGLARLRPQPRRSDSPVPSQRRAVSPVGNHLVPPAGPAGGVDGLQRDVWTFSWFAESETDLRPLGGAAAGHRPLHPVLRQKTSAAPPEESPAPEGWRGLVSRGHCCR